MTLTNAAHAIAVERMTGEFGNQLSEQHTEALYRTVGMFSMVGLGLKEGRIAISMATGCGKSLSLVAWLTAVHRMNLDIGVVITASQVEALASLTRDLCEQGVPADKMGLIHSKRYCAQKSAEFLATEDPDVLEDKFASMPATTDNAARQFLFVTHSRINAAANDADREAVLTDYKGRKRNLCIWDETAYSSAPMAATWANICSGVDVLVPQCGGSKTIIDLAVSYLSECKRLLGEEIERQRAGNEPTAITLPDLSELEQDKFLEAIRVLFRNELPFFMPSLKLLITAAGQQLRMALMGDAKSALVSFQVKIPPTLKNMVVLDASHEINKLVALDKTITHDEWFKQNSADGRHLKTYEAVEIHLGNDASGRTATEKAFDKGLTDPKGIASSIVQVIKDIPEDEAIIVFTFKTKPNSKANIHEVLFRELRKAGIDPDVELEKGRPRIKVLTFGNHTTLNRYAYATNCIFAGLLHMSDEMLLAWAVGQMGNLLAKLDGKTTVADLKRGELVSVLYQGISRAACRYTMQGKAKKTKVWVAHYDHSIKPELERVMPGVTWKEWNVGRTSEPAKIETITLQVVAHLRDHPQDRVSNRSIKSALGLQDTPPRTFAAATAAAKAPGWERVAASFVRTGTAASYGFTTEAQAKSA